MRSMMYRCIEFSLRTPLSLEVKATCSLRDPTSAAAVSWSKVAVDTAISKDAGRAHRVGLAPTFLFSQICKTSSKFYLKVEPELIWLTEDNNFSQDVEVRSNVEWTIE